MFRGSKRPIADGEGRVPGGDGLVEIRRCNQAEAMVVKSLLESDAIPTLLRSRLAHSVHPFTVGAQGEVVIFVPVRDAARAARLLVRLVSQQPPRSR